MTDTDRLKAIEELRKNQDNNGIEIDLKKLGFENPEQGNLEFSKFLSRNGYFILTNSILNKPINPHYYLLKKEEFYILRSFEDKKEGIHTKETIKNIIGNFNKNFDEYFNYLFNKLILIKETAGEKNTYYMSSEPLEGPIQITYWRYSVDVEAEYALEKLRNETQKLIEQKQKTKDMIDKNNSIQDELQKLEHTLHQKVIDINKDLNNSKDELNKMENNMKNSFLTFTGIFISIFTLITVNISIFNDALN